MAEFAWRAVAASGDVRSGRMDAASAEQALQRLKSQGWVPLAVTPVGGGGPASAAVPTPQPDGPVAGPVAPGASPAWPAPLARWRRDAPVTRRDVQDLTHELAVMLRAGLPLAYALRVLIDMNGKPAVRAVLQTVLDDVKDGAPLSRALARRPDLFGDFHLSMVRAGEASGQLAVTLQRLAEHLARQAALRESVVSAATYPAILLLVAVLSLVGIVGFVVPQFEKLFADMGDGLPMATRVVLGLSHFVQRWGLEAALLLALAGWLLRRWLRTPAGRARSQTALLRLPLVGSLLRGAQVSVYARTLGTLVGNGVPLLAALDIAAATVSNLPMRDALARATPLVKSGGRLAVALEQTRQFEPLAVNLVRVGEETGRLGPMLLELADLGDRRTETLIKRLLTLLEPAMIVLLGLLIAGIIVAILLGVLSVNELAV